jgi:hypothetical protein
MIVSCVRYPEHPSWSILLAAYATPSVPAVATARPGVCCPCLLRSAGRPQRQNQDPCELCRGWRQPAHHHLGLLAVMEDKNLALGRFGRTEFAEHNRRCTNTSRILTRC